MLKGAVMSVQGNVVDPHDAESLRRAHPAYVMFVAAREGRRRDDSVWGIFRLWARVRLVDHWPASSW